MERISGQLSASNERIRQLQETVDEKSRSTDDALNQFVEQQKSNAELEKELVALKSELMNSSIQLDYNKQRVEALEKQLQDTKLQQEKQIPKVNIIFHFTSYFPIFKNVFACNCIGCFAFRISPHYC